MIVRFQLVSINPSAALAIFYNTSQEKCINISFLGFYTFIEMMVVYIGTQEITARTDSRTKSFVTVASRLKSMWLFQRSVYPFNSGLLWTMILFSFCHL